MAVERESWFFVTHLPRWTKVGDYSSDVLIRTHSTHPWMQQGFIPRDAISGLICLVGLFGGLFGDLVVLGFLCTVLINFSVLIVYEHSICWRYIFFKKKSIFNSLRMLQ